MSFITKAQARAAAPGSSLVAAASELRKAAQAPITTTFDVFLSHSFEDAELIAGIKALIERDGRSVYVDWIVDADAERLNVTRATAELLRQRMQRCRFLLFAASESSPKSKWMPWELGYFDGLRRGGVGILPIVESAGSTFTGQEYLGLYPKYELIEFTTLGKRLGHRTTPGQGETLEAGLKSLVAR